MVAEFHRGLSVRCELVSTLRSSAHELTHSGGERLPLRQRSGAAFLVGLTIDKVSFSVEVVVQTGVD